MRAEKKREGIFFLIEGSKLLCYNKTIMRKIILRGNG